MPGIDSIDTVGMLYVEWEAVVLTDSVSAGRSF
jgi:hypothetical protein